MIYTTDIMGYQWELFLKSLYLGIVLSGCYDAVRMVRTVIHFGKRLFIASDFIYCLWAGFLTFSFLLNENFGMPRFYIFLGAALGFLAWHFTMGKAAVFFAKRLRRFLKRFLSPMLIIFRKSLKAAKKRMTKAKIFCKKAIMGQKILLKSKSGLVYNILCLNVSKAFSFCGEKAGKEPEKIESSGTEKTEKGVFPQDCSYCIRGVSSHISDIDAVKH